MANDALIKQILTNCGLSCVPELECNDCLTQILLALADSIPASTVWYSEYQKRYSAAFTSGYQLTSLYQETLIGDTIYTDGSWLGFSYHLQTGANENFKEIFVKFANQTLVSFIPSAGLRDIYINGVIKALNIHTKTAYFELTLKEYISNSSDTDLFYSGNLTGVNFNSNNKLILQGQGIVFGDVTAINGQGTINILPSL